MFFTCQPSVVFAMWIECVFYHPLNSLSIGDLPPVAVPRIIRKVQCCNARVVSQFEIRF
jgi:hypothetical protein